MHDPGGQWLPPLIEFSSFGGDWPSYEAAIYNVFRRDFENDLSRPSFQGRRLGLKKHPIVDGKSATYWHFISEGKVESERTPDMRRCERIGWPRVIIESAGNPSRVAVWRQERPSAEPRWVLALTDFSYVVILADREAYLLPWTAFYVEHQHQRRKFAREHEAYLARRRNS